MRISDDVAGPPRAGPSTVFLSAAWTAASQIATMALGASMAIVLVLRFGKSTQTDAAFAAYGVYGVLLVLCLGFRVTVAPRLAEGASRFATFDHFLGASMSLLLATGIVLVGLGDPIAAVLGGRLGPEARETIRVSLAILWIALFAQLVGSLGAALLGVRGEFGLPALAYLVGSLGTFACLLLLLSALGVLALPASIAIGSALMAAVMLARISRVGYVPRPGQLMQGLGDRRTVILLLVASISPVAWQFNYVISLAFAARLGAGAVTLYTYAFAAAGIVSAMTASTGSLVLAGRMSQTWDRRPESLLDYLRPMLRAGLLITLPALVLAAWVGDETIELLLGRSLSQSDAHTIVATFVLLGGMLIATLATQVPVLAAFTLSWYGRIALLVLATNVVHFAFTALASTTGELALFGLAASISAVVALVVAVAVVFGKRAAVPLLLVGREVGQLGVVCAAAFVPLWLASTAMGSRLWDIPLVVAGLGLFGVLLRSVLPEHYDLAARIARQVIGAGRRAGVPA
jgi:peptidoglycan biosynthesis protein MviN/MurJ (putative lipid II flippase)